MNSMNEEARVSRKRLLILCGSCVPLQGNNRNTTVLLLLIKRSRTVMLRLFPWSGTHDPHRINNLLGDTLASSFIEFIPSLLLLRLNYGQFKFSDRDARLFYFTFYYLGSHLSPTTLTNHVRYSPLIHQSYILFSRYCLSPTTHFNPTNSVSTSPCCIRLCLSLTKATLVTY